MKRKDYKCLNCSGIAELVISDTAEFPEEIDCPFCKHVSVKVISAIPAHVIQGRCGNYKNGYNTNQGYIKKT
jgi:DNA-directed RNA polymerase subunit RPC12/RpoP